MRRVNHLPHLAREVGLAGVAGRVPGMVRQPVRRKLLSLTLVKTALVVRERTGKSLSSQAREIAALRFGVGRLPALDYFAYELYDDRRYSFDQKREFVGWNSADVARKLNDPRWRVVCDDKLICYTVLRGLCLPHPEVYAVYHPGRRTYGATPCVRTPEGMADFLRRDMSYPFFGKPVRDAVGRGATSVDAIDRDRDVLILHGGREIRVDEYVATVPAHWMPLHQPGRNRPPMRSGYLFQARVVQHPMLDRITGGRISRLRMVVLMGPAGPHLFRVTWKIAVGQNVTDHLARQSGNIKCPVHLATGRVERALQDRRRGATSVYGLGHEGTTIETHPDTGERLVGVELVDWDRAVALCLHAAAAFPGIRYQAWDVVLSAAGPEIIDLNYAGGLGQIPGERGFYDAQLRQFMAGVGQLSASDGTYVWPPLLRAEAMIRQVGAAVRTGVSLLRRTGEVGPARAATRALAIGRKSLVDRFPDFRLAETALVVRQRTGKSLASQAREIAALRLGPGKLRPFDYYAYELYDDQRYSFAEKQEFVGWNLTEQRARLAALNDPQWRELCDDKLLTYAALRGLRIPHPEVYAVYHELGRTFGSIPVFRTPAELEVFLYEEMRYPFFGKPVGDAFGRGATSVDAVDRQRGVLLLACGDEISVERYVEKVTVAQRARKKRASGGPTGYLFQERIVQHPLIHRLSGGRVSSLRMVVLNGAEGPHLFRVIWKLPVGCNITDNMIGTSGNLKCSVDPRTGRVERALQGRDRKGTAVYALGHYGTAVEAHPDTAERLVGVQLPDWERTVALCLDAAAAFPGLRYQSWDFVMCARGPGALELNFSGSLAQLPGCPGLYDAEFRQFVGRRAGGPQHGAGLESAQTGGLLRSHGAGRPSDPAR